MTELQMYSIREAGVNEPTDYVTSQQDAIEIITLLFEQEIEAPFQKVNSVGWVERTKRSQPLQVMIKYQEDADSDGGGYENYEVWDLFPLKTIADLKEQ